MTYWHREWKQHEIESDSDSDFETRIRILEWIELRNSDRTAHTTTITEIRDLLKSM